VTKLLSAHAGRVYLDVHTPRVCIRGPEDFSLIAFAIFDAGYGPDNLAPFASEFETGDDL
jgi:hypothetical protein